MILGRRLALVLVPRTVVLVVLVSAVCAAMAPVRVLRHSRRIVCQLCSLAQIDLQGVVADAQSGEYRAFTLSAGILTDAAVAHRCK